MTPPLSKKLHIVSLFHLNVNIAGKDMFLVPMYIGRHLGACVELVYPQADFNQEFGNEYRGVKLTPIKSNSQYYCTLRSEKEMGWWLIKNARRIDVLSLFWLNNRNIIFARIYKLLNPRGVCYIKGDMSFVAQSKVKWKRYISQFCYQAVDIFSVETQDIYSKIIAGALGKHLAKSVALMSNGFDINMFETMAIKRKSYAEKENIMLTVGRIGSVQKNNEMILSAIDGIDINGWQILLVGPVEDGFMTKYNTFIARNPDKQDKVLLLGAVSDRERLWEIYNKSKVFLLTSSYECMAQVFSEALAFGNYIITTDVQGAKEITDYERLGRIVGVNDVDGLRQVILEVIRGSTSISHISAEAITLSNQRYNWRSLTASVAEKIKEIYDAKRL